MSVSKAALESLANEKAVAVKAAKIPAGYGAIMRFPRALREIAKVSQFGANKYHVRMGDMSYLDVEGADQMYLDAEARHMTAEAIEGPINEQDGGLYHKAQKAWNALADLEVFLRNQEKSK